MKTTSERLNWIIYGAAEGLTDSLGKQWVWSYLSYLL